MSEDYGIGVVTAATEVDPALDYGSIKNSKKHIKNE